jgi:hypothetical protein
MFGIEDRSRQSRRARSRQSRAFRPEASALEERRLLTGGYSVAYHGGPLISNAKVDTLFLGSNPLMGQINTFMASIIQSPYIDMLAQYGVGRGSYQRTYDLTFSSSNISDAQIQTYLETEVSLSRLDQPTANTLYFVYTPPGTYVSTSFGSSVTAFLGYHSTFVTGSGARYNYAVVPYPSAPNATLPSSWGLTQFQDVTAVSSHELAEAITDPTSQGWYSNTPTTYGIEIGDIALTEYNYTKDVVGALNGYTVQREWSNLDNTSILHPTYTYSIRPSAVSPIVGTSFSGTVATFTVSPSGVTGSFSASINWGDGGTSSGTVTFNPITGQYTVAGTHTYAAAGGFTISLTVQNPLAGTAATTDPITVRYPTPTLTSISPNQVGQGSASALTISVTGAGFYPQSVVDWNGTALATTYVSPTSLTATIPAADFTTAGYDQVTVANPSSGGGSSTSLAFAVDYPTPAVTSIAPTQIAEGYSGPLTLTVLGSNFYPQSVINWNGTPLPTTYFSSGALTATIPASDFTTPGNEQITVTNPAPCASKSNARTFVVDFPTPTMTSVAPNQVTVGYSGPLTITVLGTQFYPQSVIDWNGSPLTTTYVSPGALTATIPAVDFTALGGFPITVVNPAPGGGRSVSQTFQVVPNPVPVLTSMSSTEVGANDPSAWYLAITGSNFVPGSVIDWNSTPLPTTFVSSTEVYTYIPASDLGAAGTFAISVFNPAPGGGSSNSAAFHVVAGTQTYYAGSGSYYVLQNTGELDLFNGGTATVVDTNYVTSFAAINTGSATFSEVFALESSPPDSTNGSELVQWTNVGGRQAFDGNDVLSFALGRNSSIYTLDGNVPGATNGAELRVFGPLYSGWTTLDSNDVTSFALSPDGTTLYDIEGNCPGWPDGGRLVQYTAGGWTLLDGNDVLSFALSPDGATIYDLQGNWTGSAHGPELAQYTVGVGWSLIDNNDVLSFAMSPTGATLYALEGYYPGDTTGGRLVQYTQGTGPITIDSNNVSSFAMSSTGWVLYTLDGATGNLEEYAAGSTSPVLVSSGTSSFAMAPSGVPVYALGANGNLTEYTRGAPILLDTNGISSFAMAPNGVTVYELELNGDLREYSPTSVPGGTLLDSNGTRQFAMAPNGVTYYDLEYNGYLWQYSPGVAPVLLDANGTNSFAMAPNGVTIYDLETNGELWQFTEWVGWTELDGDDVLSFSMSPSGTTVFALEGNGNRLVKLTVGLVPSLVDANIQGWWRESGLYGPDTLYVRESDGSVVEYAM